MMAAPQPTLAAPQRRRLTATVSGPDGLFDNDYGVMGTYRVRKGDTVEIQLLAGCQVNLRPSLVVTDPLGSVTKDSAPKRDKFGSCTFVWTAELPGPHGLCFEYYVFDESLGVNSSQHTNGGGQRVFVRQTEETASNTPAGTFTPLQQLSTSLSPPTAEEDDSASNRDLENDRSFAGDKQKANGDEDNEEDAHDEDRQEEDGQEEPTNAHHPSSLSSNSEEEIADRPTIGQRTDPVLSSTNVIVVEPDLQIAGEGLTSNGLCMQTVLSRCIGPINRWKEALQLTGALGYNVLHFTPLQTVGESGSCYSIANQNEIDPFFTEMETMDSASCSAPSPSPSSSTADYSANSGKENASPESESNYENSAGKGASKSKQHTAPGGSKSGVSLADCAPLTEAIRYLEQQCNIMSTTDLVFNHTASNSPWIAKHPECGYNLTNSPHLRAACELDLALQEFSSRLVKGHFKAKHGACQFITNEEELSRVMQALRDECISPFHLKDFFEIDVEGCLNNFRAAASPQPAIQHEDEVAKGHLYEAAIVTVGMSRNKGVIISGRECRKYAADESALSRILQWVQGDLFALGHQIEGELLNSIENLVRWERMVARKGPLTDQHWNALTPRYFTPLVDPNGSETTVLCANNGWVADWDATKDFASPGCMVYLRRALNVWGDCIKLNYGTGPDACPFLWKWIEQYARDTAKVFAGVRLDNCHSTPVHVAQHMLRECRKVRPDIWVYAELFTGSEQTDLYFERTLGLNALIREGMQTHSPEDLAVHTVKYGGQPLGALSPIICAEQHPSKGSHSRIPLLPTLADALFFDCTHDNETPTEKRTAADALPTAAAVAASCCALGSTRGFDELVPKHLSVVTERRRYQGASKQLLELLKSPELMTAVPETPKASTGPPQVTVSWVDRNNLTPTQVVVRGSWDGWAEEIPLARRDSNEANRPGSAKGLWTAQVPFAQIFPELKPCQFKFVADGDWFHDPSLPSVSDEHGNVNNLLQPTFVSLASPAENIPSETAGERGFLRVRAVLNRLHTKLAKQGFTEIRGDQKGVDLFVLTRHNPTTRDSCHFIIRSKFWAGSASDHGSYPVIELCGKVSEVHCAASLSTPDNPLAYFDQDGELINGLTSHLSVQSSLGGLFDVSHSESSGFTSLKVRDFPPGSVAVFSTTSHSMSCQAKVEDALARLDEVVNKVDFLAMNYLLFSCEQEERDRTGGARGLYCVPDHGDLVYAGLAGPVSVLDQIRATKNSSHPLFRNVSAGDWLFDYLTSRLLSDVGKAWPGVAEVGQVLTEAWKAQQGTPSWLRPFFFDKVVSAAFSVCRRAALARFPACLSTSEDFFVQELLLATLQFYGRVPSAPLVAGTDAPSICAGLPHFSTSCMRNWGRDTFIAISGCLLATGRFDEARAEILGFARTMRHGLIPNLLDSGRNPRFNARDATWWFMQAVQDYCRWAPNGLEILAAPVHLIFPPHSVTQASTAPVAVQTLADVVHFIFDQHARGINFTELNAGKNLDEHMTAAGFEVTVRLLSDSGVIIGGSAHNCGTWMDKMGSSEKAKNKGLPATPRDGAAIEIIALLKSALRFFSKLEKSSFPYKTVSLASGQELTYTRWNSILEARFEKMFYIPQLKKRDHEYFVESGLIRTRGIYKDTYKASNPRSDYQLRCNMAVAMMLAPELFNQAHARGALRQAEESLWSPKQLGLKTLDEKDPEYVGDYDNANDTDDPKIAHGFNYHQGPEWVWPLGCLLQAKFINMCGGVPIVPDHATSKEGLASSADEKPATGQAAGKKGANNEGITDEMLHSCLRLLVPCQVHMRTDPWRSLPELTNSHGSYCAHSCRAQAWSVATILNFFRLVACKMEGR